MPEGTLNITPDTKLSDLLSAYPHLAPVVGDLIPVSRGFTLPRCAIPSRVR